MFYDRELTCFDCGDKFIFSASEQEFFKEKGFNNPPKRCSQCRTLKNRSKKNNSIKSNRQQREMFSAMCADCGKESKVPVKPSNEYPLYCIECFQKRREENK